MADSAEKMNADKRFHERLSKSYRVVYRRMEDISAPSPAREGVIVDVSGGGICFLAGEPIEEDSQLSLLVEFSGWVVDENGDWAATGNDSDVAELEVLAMATRCEVSQAVTGRFEIGVRFCGRIG